MLSLSGLSVTLSWVTDLQCYHFNQASCLRCGVSTGSSERALQSSDCKDEICAATPSSGAAYAYVAQLFLTWGNDLRTERKQSCRGATPGQSQSLPGTATVFCRVVCPFRLRRQGRPQGVREWRNRRRRGSAMICFQALSEKD